MNQIKFIVPGTPVPKARPRVTRRGTYTPKKTRAYEQAVYTAWKEQSGVSFPAGAPLVAYIYAHFPIPSSLSKKRQQELVGKPHTKQRGDLDNVVKSVLDALNGCAFPDDCVVCRIHAEKDYMAEPSTEITIRPYNEEEST